ncbi:MAG TPA: GntR family transcriptional regulator [Pyrinomonadaceae bacterium]|nr:GntR family transcriptional regulator [Pyrinomonadaceae bacterium]HMP66010.1 GntR family transcriptional regulator [Pyrinomonadaceae bacterium]
MKLWLTKNAEVPVREQLSTQIELAVAAGDLLPGDRVPSTQEIARRFGVHANTVASAYRALVEEGMLEFRPGSGYFVTGGDQQTADIHFLLRRKVEELVAWARAHGIESEEISTLLGKNREDTARRVLLVESDRGLRDILRCELQAAGFSVECMALEEFRANGSNGNGLIVAMFDERRHLEPLLTNGERCVFLTGRSVAESMTGETRPDPDRSIGVLSGWDGFLTLSRIMLLAAKVEPGQLIVRSRNDADWEDALRNVAFVICDPLSARSLPRELPARIFRVVSDESLREVEALF